MISFVFTVIHLILVLRKDKADYDLGQKEEVINHVLFMDDLEHRGKTEKQLETLVNMVRIFSSDICIEFGHCEMGMPMMRRGKYVRNERNKLPNEEEIKNVDLDMG